MAGIITVLNTPFTADDTIDTDGVRRNVRNAIDAGVAGFLVPAMASEVGSLTDAERGLLLDTVLAECCGRVPVIGGTSAPDQASRLRLTRDAIDRGCGGVLVNMPFTDEHAYERDLAAIAALAPGFIMVQDWDAVGPGMPVPFIVRLFERIPLFTWLKVEVVPAGPKYTEVLDATNGALRVAGGWAVMEMIDALDRGVHAFMPTGMHRIYVAIYNRYRAGDRAGAYALFEKLLPVLRFSNQELNVSIAFFKQLLHRHGVYATANCRAPVKTLDATQQRRAEELIERVCSIETLLEQEQTSP